MPENSVEVIQGKQAAIEKEDADLTRDSSQLDIAHFQEGEEKQDALELQRMQETTTDLALTIEEVKKMEAHLTAMTSSDKTESFVSKIARVWAVSPFWKKFILGTFLTAPTFAVALVANMGTLFVISGFTLLTVLGGGAALSDHHALRCIIETLQHTIKELGELLAGIINKLAHIASALQFQVDRFEEQNNVYVAMLAEGKKQLCHLIAQCEVLSTTVLNLREQKNQLEKLIQSVQSERVKDANLLEQYKAELNGVKKDLSGTQEKLTQKTTELQDVHKRLSQEVENMQKAAEDWKIKKDELFKLTQSLAAHVVRDDMQRQNFEKRVNTYLESNSANLEVFTGSLATTQANLAATQEKLHITQLNLDTTQQNLNITQLNFAEVQKNLVDTQRKYEVGQANLEAAHQKFLEAEAKFERDFREQAEQHAMSLEMHKLLLDGQKEQIQKLTELNAARDKQDEVFKEQVKEQGEIVQGLKDLANAGMTVFSGTAREASKELTAKQLSAIPAAQSKRGAANTMSFFRQTAGGNSQQELLLEKERVISGGSID